MIFIFCDQHQASIGEEYAKSFNSKLFNNFPELIQSFKTHYNRQSKEQIDSPIFLLLLSQPSEKEIKQIGKMNFYQIFSHPGIHHDSEKVDSIEVLRLQIDAAKREHLIDIRESYAGQFSGRTEEELRFLEKKTGIKVEMPDTRQEPEPNSGAGRLVTYRGSSAGFLQTLKLLKGRNTRILCIDGDLLRPDFENIFRIGSIFARESTHLTGLNNTGINVCIQSLERGMQGDEALRASVKKYKKNVDILLGNYNIYNYEYYERRQLESLLSLALSRYDLVLIRLPMSIYDELGMISVHRASYNIISVEPEKADLRYWNQVVSVFTDKQDISKEKIGVFKRGSGHNNAALQRIFGRSYIGDLMRGRTSSARLKKRMAIK